MRYKKPICTKTSYYRHYKEVKMSIKKHINFTPFTQAEIASIMDIRHTVKPRQQLYTSSGVKVYMMTLPKE